MKPLTRNIIIVFITIISNISIAQIKKIDSLISVSNKYGNDTNKVKTLYKIADLYKKNYKYDSALYFSQKSLAIAKKIKAKKFEASNYGLQGMIQTNEGKFKDALISHQNSLEIKKSINDKVGIANSYNNIGDVYYQMGNYAESLVNHFKSLKLKEEIQDKNSIANSYNNIGSVYHALNNYDESLKYHFLSLSIREELKDKSNMAMSYNNIAINYNAQKNYNEAVKYQQLAIKKHSELSNKKGLAIAYGNAGNTFYHLQNYPEALSYYQNSLKIRQEISDKKGIASCYHNIANVYIKLKNYSEARSCLNKALVLNEEMNSLDFIKDNYYTNSTIYLEEGNDKEALIYYKKYIQLRDSIFNIENDKKSNRAQIQYEFDKQQAINESEYEKQKILSDAELQKNQLLLEKNHQSILILNQENELKKLSLNKSELELKQKTVENSSIISAAKRDHEKNKLILQFVAGIIFLLFIIVAIIVRSLLINRKKNKIIAHALDEKEVLLKEIHHRVKNNLQVISSLLNLQSRYVKDAGALDALKESKERINAISLLHKEIYQNEVLKLINAKEYFVNLITNLQNTFDPKKNVLLETQVENVYLDIDTLIPLGLIVNELYTNCYKYGVSNQNPCITFILTQQEKQISLIVKDNGNGFPETIDMETTNSLGFKLVSLFTKKLLGTVVYTNNNGSNTAITFKIK